MTDDEIFHRLICAWNGRDPDATKPDLSPANKSTREGWLRVYQESLAIAAGNGWIKLGADGDRIEARPQPGPAMKRKA